MNSVTKSPNEHPSPSAREYADDWNENVIEPLQKIRDHLYWLAVIRRKPTASWFEMMVKTLLRMAIEYKGRLARGEE